MKVEEVRALFPAVTRASYLNAAAASPLSEPVHRAIADHYREAMEWGDVGFVGWLQRKESARAKLARLCGATPEELAFMPSTSMGFHFVGQLLQQHGVKEVVTLEGEFPSTTLPLLNLGMQLRVVKVQPDGTYSLDDLANAITARTGAVVLSAVQYASGFRIDLPAVSRLCRSRKVFLAINAVQALGQVPVDVKALEADFLCATSHKWMMGGYGVGLLYVRQALLQDSHLPVAGWLSTERPMEMDNLAGAKRTGGARARSFLAQGAHFRSDASAMEAGSLAWGPLFGMEAAAQLLLSVGVEEIQQHNARLQTVLRERLRARGFVPNAPDGMAQGSGICVFPVQGAASAVARELGKRGVVVTARGGGLRISTHVFNQEVDLDQLLWALEKAEVQPAPPVRTPARPRKRARG